MKKIIWTIAMVLGGFLLGFFLRMPTHEITMEDVSNRDILKRTDIAPQNMSFCEIDSSLLSPPVDVDIPLPDEGVIPTAEVAAKVALALSIAKYGDEVLEEMPLQICPIGGVWKIQGTLRDGVKGGVIHIELNKSDGKIRSMWHDK
jgi:hypothetical protein